ncbi:MAG: HAMP domain-containing histidine kinase [Cyclobacteriaceae bacterium]|nr:HAMP domain-containing histidine kinase [Cyclobacteriaceae bacterium]
MGFKSFKSKLAIRILLLAITVALAVTFLWVYHMWPVSVTLALIFVWQAVELHNFVNNTNRKLQLFLDSVQYSDFVTTFSVDNALGNSFKNLNESFNSVLDAFKDARISTEENLQYLNLVVEHVDTGLISFDEDGKVEVMNGIAVDLLGTRKIRSMNELKETNPDLYATIWELPVGEKALFHVNENINLSIRATQFTRRGKFVKLVALQNIQHELNAKELESWQNLLRVLRHEIMNSMTPISSMASTLQMILDEDLEKKGETLELSESVFNDIQDSLGTIESRSKGLINFIKGYQEYTSLPAPRFKVVSVKNLVSNVEQLMLNDFRELGISLNCEFVKKDFQLLVDEQQIEQVLINLVKNAREAFTNQEVKRVVIRSYQQYQYKVIEVEDNGPGIIPEALDQIFIPFYTTKKSGSGIGLSLSRQLVQMNNGNLTVSSEPNRKTVFKLVF